MEKNAHNSNFEGLTHFSFLFDLLPLLFPTFSPSVKGRVAKMSQYLSYL